jgi:hypothetical protein
MCNVEFSYDTKTVKTTLSCNNLLLNNRFKLSKYSPFTKYWFCTQGYNKKKLFNWKFSLKQWKEESYWLKNDTGRALVILASQKITLSKTLRMIKSFRYNHFDKNPNDRKTTSWSITLSKLLFRLLYLKHPKPCGQIKGVKE